MMSQVYHHSKHSACTLSPAAGTTAGLVKHTAGPAAAGLMQHQEGPAARRALAAMAAAMVAAMVAAMAVSCSRRPTAHWQQGVLRLVMLLLAPASGT
jgi:hypothetical protein